VAAHQRSSSIGGVISGMAPRISKSNIVMVKFDGVYSQNGIAAHGARLCAHVIAGGISAISSK